MVLISPNLNPNLNPRPSKLIKIRINIRKNTMRGGAEAILIGPWN